MTAKLIFNQKNVLIIGGAGFIGSHLADRLVDECKIICVDNFSSGTEKNIDHLLAHPNFKFIKHDMSLPLNLEDFTELEDFRIEFQGVQEIYNLACPTSPKYFDKNKLANVLANSYVVKNALDLALRYSAKLMHFSSSVVYGKREDNFKHIKESDIGLIDHLSERASYDEGKRFAETMVKTYREIYKVDAKIIRLFRIYGSRMSMGEGHMIPDFVEAALDNKDLIIYGDKNFSTSLCYIDDCLSGILKVMETDLFGPFNIGSDIDLKIVAVAEKIIAETNSSSKILFEKQLIFMTQLPLPDISLAREVLAWMPLTTLENGLKKTIIDIQANRNIRSLSDANY